MKQMRNWLKVLLLALVIVAIGIAVLENDPKLSPELVAIENSLNDWNQFDLQAVAEQTNNYLPSGQTNAHIELHQEQLARYGYVAVWSQEKSRFLVKRNGVFRRFARCFRNWQSKHM